jgi:signal peptidase I
VSLSLLVPGLGQVYNGDLRRGMRLWSLLIALFVVPSWLGALDHFLGLVLVILAAVSVLLYILFDAWGGARRLAKRIVGLPGEELDIRDKVVFIDGAPLDEEAYARFVDPTVYPDSPSLPGLARLRDQTGPIVIPEGTVFVLGDNRDQSFDSRVLGPVPISYLRGRPLYVYWNRDLSRIGRRIE